MNTKVAKHLSIPENRINYSFYFLDNFGYEFVDYKKWVEKCYPNFTSYEVILLDS